MRIISGRYRGRRLRAPSDARVRPTTDRIRESLFSILGGFDDEVVVDGYAGTGALGLEALSRGARAVWFIDVSRDSVRLVEANIETLGAQDETHVITGAFEKALERVTDDIDVVFLDPPYGSAEPPVAMRAIAMSSRARAGALVILEQDRADAVPQDPAFEVIDERNYGSTRVTFYRKTGVEGASTDDNP